MNDQLPEPWLRGTLTEVPAVQRAVLHALEMAKEDVERWCGGLTDQELNARPAGIAPVAFHVRHIAGSLDRLLTYAEGNSLTVQQLTVLKTELELPAASKELFAEFTLAIERSAARVRAFDVVELEQARGIGRKQLPTSVAGLLVHVADHTQRHVGQAITTAKVVRAGQTQT
jgi:hypothetical protein